MSISETAAKNHEELFPQRPSTLSITDPELVEVFDNFAFDEVLAYGSQDKHTRMMMILASLIASQTLSEYRVMLTGALNIGLTPIEVKEIVYQAVPYVGMAKVYDFLKATNEVLEARGIQLPLEGQSTTNAKTRFVEGLSKQKSIFGDGIEKRLTECPEDEAHINRYLADNCFGDFITRKGIPAKDREQLTFSMLLSLGGCESQLKGHIQGNLNLGNDRKTLISVLTQLLPYVGYPRTLNALRCIDEIVPI
jgi:4-carboxymuconolactone decarboxylase